MVLLNFSMKFIGTKNCATPWGGVGVAEFQDECHPDKKPCHTTGGGDLWLNFMVTKNYAAPEGGVAVVFGAVEFQDELHIDKKLHHTRGGCLVWLNFRMNSMVTKNCAAQQGGD